MSDNLYEYVSLDPGEKRIGWAGFDAEGLALKYGVFKDEDEMLDWLESDEVNPQVIIVESYRARPGATNAWSRLPTVQQIGAIKRVARRKKIPIVEQDPNPCLVMGLRFLGVFDMYANEKGKLLHVPDEFSALAHGTYYLRKQRIQK